jgi:hypothetical protein
MLLLQLLLSDNDHALRNAADDGVIAWDCKYHEEVMLIPHIVFTAGDNPMQAEECSHGGLRCNFFCQTCKVGGTNVDKKSDAGCCSIFKACPDLHILCVSKLMYL